MLWACSVAIALTVPSLGVVLNVVGGLGGTGLAFVLPCAVALKLEEEPLGGRAFCWVVLVTGGLVGLTTTFATFASVAFNHGQAF